MSLGPPFDHTGLNQQRWVGFGVVLLLLGAVAWVLLMSGRTVGSGVVLRIEMTSTGPLRSGAKVKIAGREVGEVRNAQTLPSTGMGMKVQFDAFIARAWAGQVRSNSQFFVSTPSVLGEAFLEIGAPPHGEEPGPPVKDGDRVVGADPPDIDRFFTHAEASIREVMAFIKEDGPALDELLSAGEGLLATLSGLPGDRGQLRRIVDQSSEALDAGRGLIAALREAGGIDRIRKLGSELSAIADRAGPELASLGQRIDAAMANVDRVRGYFTPERADQLRRALAGFRKAATIGEKVVADIQSIERKVRSGQGSLGALLADRELFDDLHETHRIIKGQPLRFLLKTLKPKDKILP